MAFWYRINQSKLKLLSHQLNRCYGETPSYASLLNYTAKTLNPCTLHNTIWDVRKTHGPTSLCNSVRFFATSFQAKGKATNTEKDSSGPRLNDEITAQFVRLVTDEGHGVVPLREALKRARKFKLDLVEVQRKVDPPVCKIMDFHKERYQQRLKEKNRAKSQSGVTLRKGDAKEVRFSLKTEQKDLKMKADTVLRLIQRGYRVKCMLQFSKKGSSRTSSKKDSGDDDLTEEEIAMRRKQEEEERKEIRAALSQITALIEDECVVESGPNVDSKQAYVIVRHAKFGPSKKGGAKKLKDVEKVSTAQPTANFAGSIPSSLMTEEDPAESGMETEDQTISDEDDLPDKKLEDDKTSWSVVDSTDDFDRLFGPSDDVKNLNRIEEMNGLPEADSSKMNFKIPNLSHLRPVHDSKQANQPPSSPETVNRYKRSEPMERFPPTTRRDNRGPDKVDSFRFEPRFPHQHARTVSETNMNPSIGERNPVQTNSSAFRKINVPRAEKLKQDPYPSGVSGTQASGYGIFSSSKATTPAKEAETTILNDNSGQRQGSDGNGQGGWGIFGRDGPNANRISK